LIPHAGRTLLNPRTPPRAMSRSISAGKFHCDVVEQHGIAVFEPYANTLLRENVLFGSDYPLITPDR